MGSSVRYRVLLGVLLVLLATYPYLESTPTGEALLLGVTTGTLAVALWVVRATRGVLAVGSMLGIAAAWTDWGQAAPGWVAAGHAAETLFYALVVGAVARDVFGRTRVTSDTLAGAVCVYLLLGLAWTSAYALLLGWQPGAFRSLDTGRWTELLFFSFTTLSTTGYGDITPSTQAARSLALLEYVVGVLYVAILVARLVSMYRDDPERPDSQPAPRGTTEPA